MCRPQGEGIERGEGGGREGGWCELQQIEPEVAAEDYVQATG